MSKFKTHTCNEISLEDVGKKVRIAGWVETIRDFGGLVFLDIRDMYGITQVVTSGKTEDVDFASHIPIESTVTVYGTVRKRDEETINTKIKTRIILGIILMLSAVGGVKYFILNDAYYQKTENIDLYIIFSVFKKSCGWHCLINHVI